jgi:hypothetical protein
MWKLFQVNLEFVFVMFSSDLHCEMKLFCVLMHVTWQVFGRSYSSGGLPQMSRSKKENKKSSLLVLNILLKVLISREVGLFM